MRKYARRCTNCIEKCHMIKQKFILIQSRSDEFNTVRLLSPGWSKKPKGVPSSKIYRPSLNTPGILSPKQGKPHVAAHGSVIVSKRHDGKNLDKPTTRKEHARSYQQ